MARLLHKTLSTDRRLRHGVDRRKDLVLIKVNRDRRMPLACTFVGALANSLVPSSVLPFLSITIV